MGLSERPVCIKDSERYYIVFALYIVLITVYLLRQVILKIIVLSKGVS